MSSSFGAAIVGSANPDFTNSQFYNITNAPIELSLFSNPVFTNCSALNVGYMALAVIPETFSQSATVPVRSFGGYTNINYLMEGACSINSGTTITIPAGIVFKSTDYILSGGNSYYGSYSIANGFNVNGRLNILGTSENPVVFTNVKDDSYGNPKDMNQNGSASFPPPETYYWSGNWITFNDVSDDLSTVNNAVLKYGNTGISTLSASPAINNVRFEKLIYGVDMNGVSVPKIDNSTFHNLQYYPMQISLVSYPASTLNNVISGSTWKAIRVKDETLTQDVTLPKRNFGGVTNIPYSFGSYSIGTGASLTLDPGIVLKFSEYGKIDVSKGLKAIGGRTPDSTIVFTSIKDDFYGGDSNSDSTKTTGVIKDWEGLVFGDQSLDPSCKLKNCIIRFADKGISTVSASPTIDYSNINNNNYGVYATAASNPVFNNCDFDDNYYFAVDNVDKSFVISAKNSWWGSNSGPLQTDIPGNGTGNQERVTSAVDYSPWKTTGAGNPLMGDVSLNGMIQAYDAALILQQAVGLMTLNSSQLQVADVSGASGITAFDASLILQYVVGINKYFPAELKKTDLDLRTYPLLSVGSANATNGEQVSVPLSVSNVSGMVSADIKLQYDPKSLKLSQVQKVVSGMNLLFTNDSIKGIITIGMSGTYPLKSDTILAQVSFQTISNSSFTTFSALTVNKFLANEIDMTPQVSNGSIAIAGSLSRINLGNGTGHGSMKLVYPNRSLFEPMLVYQLTEDNQKVNIEVFNIIGQKIDILVNEIKDKGKYFVPILKQGNPLNGGVYFVRMTVNGFSQSQKFLIVR